MTDTRNTDPLDAMARLAKQYERLARDEHMPTWMARDYALITEALRFRVAALAALLRYAATAVAATAPEAMPEAIAHSETCSSSPVDGCDCGAFTGDSETELRDYATALTAASVAKDAEIATERARAEAAEGALEKLGLSWSMQEREVATLRAELAAARGDGERLAQFAAWAFTTKDGWRGDFDGGEVQDMGEKCGILIAVAVTEPCNENCSCADFGFPSDCYRLAPFVVEAAARSAEGGS